MSRRVRAGLAVVAVLAGTGAAGAVATGVVGGSAAERRPTAETSATATAAVERVDLVRRQTIPGTLGYGPATPVEHPASSGGVPAGRITWLPAPGESVERGNPVYAVDERPVPLLYGTTPLYRALTPGCDGQDVRVVEENLAALGYTGFTVDDHYSTGTADAVRAWQRDLGLPETGGVGPDDAVVAPGARRVAAVAATPGRAAPGPVLTWTGTERGITVDLGVRDEDLVRPGAAATVELPDGGVAEATVTGIGTAASAAPSPGGGGAPSGGSPGGSGGSPGADDATLPVTLSVADQSALGRFQAAPVEVEFVAETRKGVLAVPVNALVALREGGYAVEVVGAAGPGTSGAPAATGGGPAGPDYRPVTLGMFVNGRVEVSGPGISAGLTVVVPR